MACLLLKHGFTEYLMIGNNYIWQTRTMYLNTKWPINSVLPYPVTHDYIIIKKKLEPMTYPDKLLKCARILYSILKDRIYFMYIGSVCDSSRTTTGHTLRPLWISKRTNYIIFLYLGCLLGSKRGIRSLFDYLGNQFSCKSVRFFNK